HFSPPFFTCAPLAGPGAYCSRLVIVLSLSSFSSLHLEPCGPGAVPVHPHAPTRTGGTDRATHPPPAAAPASAGRGAVVRRRSILRTRHPAALASAWTPSAGAYEVAARSLPPTVPT